MLNRKESFNVDKISQCNIKYTECNKTNRNNCGKIHDECLQNAKE